MSSQRCEEGHCWAEPKKLAPHKVSMQHCHAPAWPCPDPRQMSLPDDRARILRSAALSGCSAAPASGLQHDMSHVAADGVPFSFICSGSCAKTYYRPENHCNNHIQRLSNPPAPFPTPLHRPPCLSRPSRILAVSQRVWFWVYVKISGLKGGGPECTAHSHMVYPSLAQYNS